MYEKRIRPLTGSGRSSTQNKTEYPYVGFYDKQGGPGNESRSEIISTNFRFITRIPRIGLVTTLTWQMIWLYKYRTLYNGSTGENVWPLYWCGTDGIIHSFTETQKEDPAFAPLLSTTAPERFLPNSYKPYGMLNIRDKQSFRRAHHAGILCQQPRRFTPHSLFGQHEILPSTKYPAFFRSGITNKTMTS